MILEHADFSPQLKKLNGELWILCLIRKKYLLLTPEEWVRQQVIYTLNQKYNYSNSLISVESALKYNQKQKRSDLVVYDRNTQPFLLIECKANRVKIDSKALEQVFMYNYIIKAQFVAVTNGLEWLCFQKNKEDGYIPNNNIPKFS